MTASQKGGFRTTTWLSLFSGRQRLILVLTLLVGLGIIAGGFWRHHGPTAPTDIVINADMSIREVAPLLGVTGQALARELGLPLDIAKNKPLRELSVSRQELDQVVDHLLSHVDAAAKYYLFVALCLAGLVFLVRLGRPDVGKRPTEGYPRLPYLFILLCAVAGAGFFLGKSPNPMEGIVKVFKSMVGLYPDPGVKLAAFLFFLCLAVIGNKLICGWACPFGALQELIYSLPILRSFKRKHRLPFALANTIRFALFAAMLLFLFGLVGGQRGFVIYHYLNPFNLFDLKFESRWIAATTITVLAASFWVYRPFCQLICPFGLVSWLAERLSIYRVRIDADKCIDCGLCIRACPSQAAAGRVHQKKMPADCFSCARCLAVCPVDAIRYETAWKKPPAAGKS